ncbi:hypothetical protein HD554DRAFT_2178429 [Boletus coccyginus]|nr:hypothetical protein HD554DRAFT_2178429 [Boletus coccyginus]
MYHLSSLTLVKLGVVLLGVFNLALMLNGPPSSRCPSATQPRQIRIHDHPSLKLLHLDTRMRRRTLLTEETAHYPVNGTLADLEWASLVPEGNHGLVVLGPDSDARPYAVTMFHTLHCLDRIRMAIVSPSSSSSGETRTGQSRYHVHHCFNYLRQMVLCAANTRLNPTNHVLPSGMLASDGIGLTYQCRDWDAVYEAFEANYALNRTMSFAR